MIAACVGVPNGLSVGSANGLRRMMRVRRMLKHFNGPYWKDYIENMIRPQFQKFGEIVLSRVMPVFDGINKEAREVELSAKKEAMEGVDWSVYDYSDVDQAVADYAFNQALDYAEMLSAMRSATMNSFTAALFHFYEQSIIGLCAEILEQHAHTEITRNQAVGWFKEEVGIDLTTLSGWPAMSELKLAANTAKHAECRDAKALRKLRPELFVLPVFRGKGVNHGPMRVRAPLFGDGLFINAADFTSYHKATVQFWTEFADKLAEKAW